jgi:lactoylglutathione lyase
VSEYDVRMVVLSTDDLDESIRFYSETLGMPLKFRDGAHFAALDGGSVTIALATTVDHPIPGKVVVGIKTADVDAAAKAVEARGGGIVKAPYNDAHERRAVVYDHQGNGLVFYSPLAR